MRLQKKTFLVVLAFAILMQIASWLAIRNDRVESVVLRIASEWSKDHPSDYRCLYFDSNLSAMVSAQERSDVERLGSDAGFDVRFVDGPDNGNERKNLRRCIRLHGGDGLSNPIFATANIHQFLPSLEQDSSRTYAGNSSFRHFLFPTPLGWVAVGSHQTSY